MRMIRVTGDTLDEMIKQVADYYRNFIDNEEDNEPISESSDKKVDKKVCDSNKDHVCRCGDTTPDISKIYWIDKKVIEDNVYTVFNVIAPFAVEDTIKAAIDKIGNEWWLTLRYTNNDGVFSECMRVNFKTRKEVEFKYNFKDFKVDKKKLRLTYNKGIISLYTVSSRTQPKSDSYVIGL